MAPHGAADIALLINRGAQRPFVGAESADLKLQTR